MKQHILIVLFCIALILLSGCKSIITESTNDKPGRPLPSHLAHCEGLNASASGDCIRKTYSNVTFCEGLDDYWKDDCYTENAKIFQNSSVCEYVQDSGRKDTCYVGVATKLAYTTKDPKYCDIAVSERGKDECLLGLFILTKNPEICDLIQDEYIKKKCVT